MADIRIFCEPARLESLIREFLHQTLERHAVLQGNRGERAHGIHQPADGAAFLRHGDEKFTRLTIFVQTDCDVPLVTGDFEPMGQRRARVRHAMPNRLVELAAQRCQFLFELENALLQCVYLGADVGYRAHVFCLASVQRRGALRAVAINRDRFQSELPPFHVSVHDVVHCGCLRHIDRFRDRTAKERLRSCHHPEMRHVTETAFTSERLERAIEDRQVLRL